MRTKVGQPYLQSTIDADRRSLEELGYFQSVDVRGTAVENDNWDVVVNVLEFPVVREFSITGNSMFTDDEILALLTVQKDKIFNLRDQSTSAKRIEEAYRKKNVLALVEEFAPSKESPNTVNIVIREAVIGSIAVQGNSRTRTSVIAKMIRSKAGEPYNRHRWEMDLRRIYGTQWFENVRSIEAVDPNDPYKVNLIVDVKETRTGQFNIGLQVDPRSSFAGVIKLQDSNFRGTGQAVGIDFIQATSGGGPSIGLDYANPFLDNRGTGFRVSLYSRLIYRFTGSGFGSQSVPTEDSRYTERRTGGSLGFSKPIDDYSAWGITTRLERIVTNNLTTTNLNGFIKQDGDVGVFTLGYTNNHRDVDVDPSSGTWMRFQVEPGISNITNIGGSVLDPSILGRHNFFRYSGEFRAYFTDQGRRPINQLDAPRRVLALRLFAGSITGKTPFFEQFFAGGSQSVRGYAEDRFWGNNTLVAQAELRFPIQKAFSVVGFVDYGGAWGGYGGVNEFTQSDRLQLHLGYGVGFSFRTPLGPLRLDIGFDEKGRSRTHFLIGTSF